MVGVETKGQKFRIMGRLEKIIDRLNQALYENRNDGSDEEDIYSAYATIRIGRKTIYMSVSERFGDVCEVLDTKYTERFYYNIEEFLYKHITPFSEIKRDTYENEYQRNGFRNEADFVHYKFG